MPANSSFNDIIRLTDREIQILMREVDQKDLVCSLKGSRKDLREKFLSNMSERVRTYIEEEMKFSKPRPEEVKEVRQRIVQQVVQLAEQGHITWPLVDKPASRPKRKAKKPGKQYLNEQRRLKKQVQRSLSELSHDEINSIFVGLGERARRQGILALENLAYLFTNDLIHSLEPS